MEFNPSKKVIETGASMLRQGKLVAFPTETVYGLGADALNPLAVARIFELKERPAFDPLIVHIASFDDLFKLSVEADERASMLARKFWPGPLTIVVPKSKIIPDIVTSGLPTVGIRMPDNEIALDLIRFSGCPVAAPSANKFGRISPTTAAHVKKYFPGIDFIINGGKTRLGIESTVVTITELGFKIVRPGLITREEIETVLPSDNTPGADDALVSPGMLKSHYSPRKPMKIAEPGTIKTSDRSMAGLLSFTGKETEEYRKVILLTKTMDLREYAVNLFEAMHRMEDSDVELIIAEPVPAEGIGLAVMDRLRKASNQKKN